MAITDLTNTTWYLKEVLDFAYIVLGTYNLSFDTDGFSYEYFKMTTPSDGEYKIEYGFKYGDSESYTKACTTYVGTQDTVWIEQAYRRIKITGGSDATNTDLIAFFIQNRTPLLGNIIAT